MKAELLTIGSELLAGVTVNTNAAYMAKALSALGISVDRQVAVPDKRSDIAAALRESLSRSDFIVTSGGLGPTLDDITIEVMA